MATLFQSSKAFTILFIYFGTCFYTLAAYLHLRLRKSWSFPKAYAMAIPLVLCEYLFSLRGNHSAVTFHGLTALQVLMITLCFYFINLYILNAFVLQHPVHIGRDLLAFVLILSAFYLSSHTFK